MRKVTIYSTIGNDMKEVMVNSMNWGDLQVELSRNGVNASGMKAIIGDSQLTLESNQAELPSGDFTLFFMPQKVKSGILWGHNDDEDDDRESIRPAAPANIENAKALVLSIGEDLNELYTILSNLPTAASPAVAKLQNQAEQLKKNMGIFE